MMPPLHTEQKRSLTTLLAPWSQVLYVLVLCLVLEVRAGLAQLFLKVKSHTTVPASPEYLSRNVKSQVTHKPTGLISGSGGFNKVWL